MSTSFSHVIVTTLITMPYSFLDDIQRVAARGYVPSEEDVVRARLRTMGVQEHRFVFEKGMFVMRSGSRFAC